jgi:hypothetical protein
MAANAYAILYDNEQDSIRLGTGFYSTTEYGDKNFSFTEGEGLPIAVRDLTDTDDGCLIQWDAKRHCLVKADGANYPDSGSGVG